MSSEHLCDQPKCIDPATVYLGLKVAEHYAVGYFACDLHEAEGFWQVTKIGLRQDKRFDIVLLDADQVDHLLTS